MCNIISIQLSEFTDSQVRLHHLNDFVVQKDGEKLVVFRQDGKPGLIPFLLNGVIELTRWAGFCRENDLDTLQSLYPKEIEIPALEGCQSGIWFPIPPQRIKGVIVPGEIHSLVYMLLKPATDYYREMTKSDWEPVYVGGKQKYLRKVTFSRKQGDMNRDT